MIDIQRILVPLFTFIWWNRLRQTDNIMRRNYVVKVKGWRTAIIDSYGRGRSTTTFLFKKWR